MIKLTVYDDITLLDADVTEWPQSDVASANVIRLTGASDANTAVQLQREGFVFADRTLKTTISLTKCDINTQRLIRLPVTEEDHVQEAIFAIAEKAFINDRRFHIKEICDSAVSTKVLKHWINEIEKALVCRFKDQVIGFLVLTETAADTLFVHLAAVDEQYRMTGAAMALYAKAVEVAKARGYKKLQGRISSQNTAVMNIYTFFGATLSEPQDIFIKEISHDAG